MEVYKVKIYPAAEQDLRDIIAYLNTLSSQAAFGYYDRLTEEIASLSRMPERYPRLRDMALAARGYRCLTVGSYLVFYVVRGDTVQIRRILYGRRDYGSIIDRNGG
jgi:toxin ParE1/3/4